MVFLRLLLLSCTLLAVGCVPLTPVPPARPAGAAALAGLVGAWRAEDAGEALELDIRAVPGAGRLTVEVRERAADGAWKSEIHEVVAGDATAGVRYRADDRSGWIPVRYAVAADGRLQLRFADADALARAVESGQIDGRVRRSGLIVEVDIAGNAGAIEAGFAAPAAEGWFGPPQYFVRMTEPGAAWK
ncbi:MAG: hypothetical protein AB7Q97_03400 [Gammaproteobacteria bacterium]